MHTSAIAKQQNDLKNEIKRGEERLTSFRKKKERAEKELTELERNPVDISKLNSELRGIKEAYEKKNSVDLLKYNDQYRKLLNKKQLASSIVEKIKNNRMKIANFKAKIVGLTREIEDNKLALKNTQEKLYEFQATINHDTKGKARIVDKSQRPITTPLNTQEVGHVYDVKWSDVTFGDHFLRIKVGGVSQNPISFPDSRNSLNKIKAIYTFRRVPHLKVELKAKTVPRIVNPEVLNYVVQFLTFGNSFDRKVLEHRIFKLSKYKKFDKAFYKHHIPQLFQPSCLAYLNENVVENLPIIPIPETVINSSGATEIHESFMFPVIQGKCIIWLWESLEDSKASYVFRTSTENLELDLQVIFDYLVGETTNKRYNLITNLNLAVQLGLRKRILHKSEKEWKAEIDALFAYELFPHLL